MGRVANRRRAGQGIAQVMNVLFLCTGNSARSILAEAILNRVGAGRFKAYSAGSQPKDRPNPAAIALLQWLGHPTDGLRSKTWDEFSTPGAPEMDLIVTVCDSAAGESCPVWLGHPATVHWGIPDPAGVGETDQDRQFAFLQAYALLSDRIGSLVALPQIDPGDPLTRDKLIEIGRLPGGSEGAQAHG